MKNKDSGLIWLIIIFLIAGAASVASPPKEKHKRSWFWAVVLVIVVTIGSVVAIELLAPDSSKAVPQPATIQQTK